MSRRIIFMLTALLVIAISAVPCFGTTRTDSSVNTICYNDGSYAVVTTTTHLPLMTNVLNKATNSLTKSSSKTYDYYDKSNSKVWTFTVSGTFTYDGTTARAIRSSCSASANSGWECTKKTSKCSGATVTGNATFRLNGVSKKATIKLTCSANGSIS